jgi:hypothetical protein
MREEHWVIGECDTVKDIWIKMVRNMLRGNLRALQNKESHVLHSSTNLIRLDFFLFLANLQSTLQ